MRTSVLWLNDYLDRPADAAEQAAALTSAGLPFDGGDAAENGEAWQEIETTSNRGDCLCHLGMAREVAAVTGRGLKLPPASPKSGGGRAEDRIRVGNHERTLCPRYTARVIVGVKVGPSPEWLQRRLIAIGQVPRNNVVDATNFVLFELGQPTHVFDLATLAGGEIHIRRAKDGEAFLPLGAGAKEVKLVANDLVIADRDRPVALAGVKGGALASVTETTTDLVLEAATFDPVSVRNTSRRHGIASDSSYRFERVVHPAEIDPAADRLAALILEIAGGTLLEGVVADGAPIPAPRAIALRPARARQILGFDIPTSRMVELLSTLGFAPRVELSGPGGGEVIHTTAPARRVDVEREIDLIEEICRLNGLDAIPVADALPIRVSHQNPVERGTRAVKDLLVGMGFVETVTHSLVAEKAGAAFLPHGATLLKVEDERAGGEPALRPSVVASLLRVRRHNEDQGAAHLRLFESASAFHFGAHGHIERPVVALLADAPVEARDAQGAYRLMRGVVERVLQLVAPRSARVEFAPQGADGAAWLSVGARVLVNEVDVGCVGIVDARIAKAHGLERPTAAAELELRGLLSAFPPQNAAVDLPAFPAADRDISAIVAETVRYGDIEREIRSLKLANLEEIAFVTTFRGKQIGDGKKSVSLRLVFRKHDGTMTSEEADASVGRAIVHLREALGAEVRS